MSFFHKAKTFALNEDMPKKLLAIVVALGVHYTGEMTKGATIMDESQIRDMLQ